jgi:hypothetical protein
VFFLPQAIMFSEGLDSSLAAATTYDVLRAASITKPDIYIPDEKVHPDNVGEVVKVVVCFGIDKIPGIGSIFSGLLGAFWPGGSPDIWESMKERIESMINEKIDENNAQQLNDRLQGLYLVLRNYSKQSNSVQVQRFPSLLNLILHDAPAFLNNKSPWRSLPHIVFFGTLYISALWTQWQYCKDIDGNETSKQAYEKELEAAISTLLSIVSKAKDACIARRREHLTSKRWSETTGSGAMTTANGISYGGGGFTTVTHEVEDKHTQTKLTISGDASLSEANKAKVWKQLDDEIFYKYGAELEKILLPTRLWSRYRPRCGREEIVLQHLEFSGWVWNGITQGTEPFDLSSYHLSHGDITRIDYYHGNDSNDSKQVFGIEIFFGTHPVQVGAKRGTAVTFQLEKDEVITRASASGATVLETIGFSKARQITNTQGKTEFSNHSSTSNRGAFEGLLSQVMYGLVVKNRPEVSSAHAEFSHSGVNSTPHPTRMLYARGWSSNDPKYGCIGLFQPVFGCKETIRPDGMSTWS